MEQETKALKLSAVGALFMAALGIVFGLLTQSDAIMLDGFFSLVGFAMAVVTIRVAWLVQQPPDEHFHFWYAQFEPFLNTVKGLLMLGVSGFAVAGAVDALVHGGRDLNPGLAVIYALIAVAGCLLIAGVQKRAARRTGSPLLEVDARNWMIDGVLSGVVALVFVAALILSGTGWAHIVPYIDPVLVIVVVFAIIGVPLKIIKDGAREILGFAPAPEVQEDVRGRVEGALEGVPVTALHVSMMKIGRFFYILNQIVVSPEFRPGRVAELDAVRARIAGAMEGFEPRPIVDTVFTEDEKWTE
ncbi:MAG: cation diffusion facilitator family transporter [marine benthic group bacterium]|nr:cation diffusion facilitator family transporter [Gemmatimonadota bacterium]